MNRYVGKKILILGAYRTEIEIINQARDMGLYTIVTDNHVDWQLAPAKYVADEAWDISWSDIDALEHKCRQVGIDACMAGFSEKRIICAQKLSTRLGKYFYTDDVDLDLVCNKKMFKDACIRNGIQSAKVFSYGGQIDFPVIVKPADNGGSRGITVCFNKEELDIAYNKAMDCSDNKTVVIEEYITGDEVMIYYIVHDGIVELSAMCDRYMKKFDDNITQLPIGYYFPSKHLGQYLQISDFKMKRLIKDLGIKNGLIAFQSFIKDGEVIPYDPTYRLDGTIAYHITERANGSNVLQNLINYSVSGRMMDVSSLSNEECPFFASPYFELPILLKDGIITEICGIDEIRKMKEVFYIYQGHAEGELMDRKADFCQMLFRIQIAAENDCVLNEVIGKIFATLRVTDENGNDMIIGRYKLSKWRKC